MVKYVTVAEISEFVLDGTHGSPKRTEDPTGVPLLSAKNILDGEVRWDNFDRVLPEEWKTFSRRLSLRPGDVLMTCVGSIGRAAVWAGNRPAVLLRSVAVIRPQRQVVPKFLEYYIRSSVFQGHLVRRTKQASQGGIYLDDIRQLPVPVVPEAEQHRIVNLLDEADELRRRREQADRRTADLIPALFYKMFGDPADGQERWGQDTLGELLANIDSGWSPTCPDRVAGPSEWGVLKLGAVTSCNYIETENKALADDADPRPELEVKAGDVLFTRKNTYQLVAACALITATRPRLMLSDLIFRLRVSKTARILAEFLWAVLVNPSMRKQIQRLASGSAGSMPNISKERLRSVAISVPPLPLQHEFAARVGEIRALQARQAESRRRLDDLFQSMLHRAFQGEL